MRNKILLTFAICTSIAFTSFGQNFNKAKLDSLFDILSQKDKAMVSVAISKNNAVIYQRAIGFASINSTEKTPATTKTRYRIGSISKTFTATMVFQLIDAGKLKLTDKLSAFFPTIPNADKITVDILLSHRSGLHNFTTGPGFMQYMTQPKTQAENIELFVSQKPDFEPGAKFEYSNTNYNLLGYIVEKITKKSYSENLNERIVSKLNLKETYYGGKTDLTKNESYSYKPMGYWIQQPETDMSVPGGSGAIVSTPAEMTTFITSLFAGKLVSKASLEQMKTLQDGYGKGMFTVPFGPKTGYGHNGSIDGFVSNLYYFPEDEVAFAICSNGVSYPLNSILLAMLSSYYNFPFVIPTFKSISVKSEELDKYLGVYSGPAIPVKITIAKNENGLTGQATGQGAFPLTPTEPNVFAFEAAGIVIVFDTSKNELTLKQGVGNFVMKKEQ
ncbi:serine hydrolase domain-containing protein [Dyadobacter psychrotolerans]|uniref:Class A beta-lactamase-related serine hydrolase n=1 Tax=Dyadobacter psychrotolerans TaxID=2541721 RepID=A0A4R5D9K3_9BACT|nr:serine hydrolase domain-containing protein [Dyadobacter psychrotolerans]TDE10259.1 class A beta-lactamase-related serine hydrolase [Dyadobacter psychrotolerans]